MSISAPYYLFKSLEIKLPLFPTVCEELKEQEKGGKKRKVSSKRKDRERLQYQNQKFLNLNNVLGLKLLETTKAGQIFSLAL